MNRKFKILAGFLMLVLLSVSVSACNYYCNNCSDCEAKVNTANEGEIICLEQDIVNYTGTCINSPANFMNKTFDCQGNTIDGDDSGWDYRIYIGNKDGNTIKNCVITDFKYKFI